jgi:hypothetical protein
LPIILLVLLVILIAQVGFWDALGAVLGAFAMIALLIVLLVATLGLAGYLILRRVQRRT